MFLSRLNRNVVVPFDFSDLSVRTLKKSLEMVGDETLLRVIHVVEHPSTFDYGVSWESMSDETFEARVNEAFVRRLKQFGDFPKLDLTIVVGNPGPQIAAFAQDVGAELIVMASKGRSGFERFLLGSVAEKVLRMAACPVLVLRDLNVKKTKTNLGFANSTA